MKLWIDDIRPAPEGYIHTYSVNMAKILIERIEEREALGYTGVELIDINHDARDFVQFGGDYIKLLDWLEETGRNYPIHIHSQNPVGVENMRAIIKRNGWEEV